ncbi:hypothetical protein BH23CHL7_BH23CHL7_12100 [soil metagenome]
MLPVFAARGLNMSKLESRPSRERAWEYVFWADLGADLCAPGGEDVLGELRAVTVSLRLMGCYPAATPVTPR